MVRVTASNTTTSVNTTKKLSAEELKAQKRKEGLYYVAPKETVYSISKKFNMSVDEFKKMTGLKKDALDVGQIISNVPTTTVKKGQYLSSIAREHNMTLNQLLELNNIKSTYIIQPGEKLFVWKTPAPESKSAEKAKESTKPENASTTQKTTPQTAPSDSTAGSTKIKLGNGKEFTAGALQRDALNSGKKDDALKNCKNPYIVRPLPNYNGAKIEATCELQPPTDKKGPLKGKVVILNPGHGGYQYENGFFDPGTICTTKNAEGEEMPVEEWKVTKTYTDFLANKLRAKGAHVIIVQGAVGGGGMSDQKYLEGLIAGKKGSDDVKELIKDADKSDMLFVSVHVEAMKGNPKAKGCSVIVKKNDEGDIALANNIKTALNKGFTNLEPTINNNRNVYVTRAMGDKIPAVLLEIGNIANPTIQASLLSAYDQNKYMDCISDAIEKTLNPPKPKKK